MNCCSYTSLISILRILILQWIRHFLININNTSKSIVMKILDQYYSLWAWVIKLIYVNIIVFLQKNSGHFRITEYHSSWLHSKKKTPDLQIMDSFILISNRSLQRENERLPEEYTYRGEYLKELILFIDIIVYQFRCSFKISVQIFVENTQNCLDKNYA